VAFQKLLEEFESTFFDGDFNTLAIYLKSDIEATSFFR